MWALLELLIQALLLVLAAVVIVIWVIGAVAVWLIELVIAAVIAGASGGGSSADFSPSSRDINVVDDLDDGSVVIYLMRSQLQGSAS